MHILIKTFDYLDIWLNFSALLFISTLDNTYNFYLGLQKFLCLFIKKILWIKIKNYSHASLTFNKLIDNPKNNCLI